MTSQRDGFSNTIKEVLAKRAGQRCSNPNCRVVTSGPHEDEQRAINLGVAAHITAAAPGGPRYNPDISPEDRSAITNGIWLCQNCAKLVDSDTTTFPEERLVMWKRRHEELVKGQIGKPDVLSRAQGLLNVSAVYQHWGAGGLSCILDFRVSNQGASDLMINAVTFQVLECLQKMPLGQATYSAVYDLDISELEEYASRAECQVAQLLKPGEADRFGIVLSAPTLGQSAGWRLATFFKTNVGLTSGPEVELWLPRPVTLHPFSAVKQHVVSQAEKLTNLYGAGALVAESEPGRSAGYKTFTIMGISIFTYYGPHPLITIPGAISHTELFLTSAAEHDPTYAKSQEMLIELLPRDLDLAFTLLQTVDIEATSDPERCQVALAKARKTVDTIRSYEGRILDLEIRNLIDSRADKLEAALSAFEQRAR